MAGVLRPSKESPLFCYAIRKLNPEIFSHPVWVRFRSELLDSPQKIGGLLNATDSAQHSNPLETCQLLLLCAACQSYTRQFESALEIIRRVHRIAKHARLVDATIWADWGAAAVCFKCDKYDEAAKYLASLKEELAKQGEWILADYAEIIRQSLCVSEIKSLTPHSSMQFGSQADADLSQVFDGLCHWGFAGIPAEEIDSGVTRTHIRQNSELTLGSPPSSLSITPGNGYSWKFAHLFREIFVSLSLGNNSIFKQWWVSLWKERVNKVHEQDNEITSIEDDFQEAVESDQESLFVPSTAIKKSSSPGLGVNVIVQMLGTFTITFQGLPLKLPASRSLSLLKYLVLHHQEDIPRDLLMDIFWPEAEPEAARNNLNVAIHSLRHALHSITDLTVIRFEDGSYGLAKALEIWLDVEEFEHSIREGQRLECQNQLVSAVAEYEIAINLYRGDFLIDTPYENWTILDRERLRVSYLETLDRLSQIHFNQQRYTASINLCELILARDSCREDIHCRLMQCYSRLGQATLALRQYQTCVNALRSELDVTPAPTTTHLYQKIRQHQRV